LDSLNQDLGVEPEKKGALRYYLTRDGYELPLSLPGFRPLTRALLAEKFETGQAVRYFEYGGYFTTGSNVELLINYHTPAVLPNYRTAKGIHLTFTYSHNRGRFEFQGIKTQHF
jgi:hypothetical protein